MDWQAPWLKTSRRLFTASIANFRSRPRLHPASNSKNKQLFQRGPPNNRRCGRRFRVDTSVILESSPAAVSDVVELLTHQNTVRWIAQLGGALFDRFPAHCLRVRRIGPDS